MSMRRVMADTVSLGSMLVTSPEARDRVIKIPEPSVNNIGRTGIQGVTHKFVQSRQELEVKVQNGGDTSALGIHVTTAVSPKAGLFKIKSDGLKEPDAVGGLPVACTDANEYMGREAEWVGHYIQTLSNSDHDSTKELLSPTMKPLEYWRRPPGSQFDAHQRVIGMLMCVEKQDATTAWIKAWQLIAVDSDEVSGGPSYVWRTLNNASGDAVVYEDWTAAITPLSFTLVTPLFGIDIDFCELEDGSWILVVVYGTAKMAIYKSYDYGMTWNAIFNKSIGVSTGLKVTIERFGSRVVIVYNDIIVDVTKLKYSDDGGVTWLDGADVDGGEGYDELRLAVNKELNKMVLVGTDSGVSANYYESFDGTTWVNKSNFEAVNLTNHAIVQDHSGRWVTYMVVGGEMVMRYLDDIDLINFASNASNLYTMWDFTDVDGLVYHAIAASSFFNGGFNDIAIVSKDDDSGSTYYSIAVLRAKMWTGIQTDVDVFATLRDWTVVWYANCFPSIFDAHPNMNHYVRFQFGTGASAIIDGSFAYLQITGTTLDQLRYTRSLPVAGYSGGLMLKFELQVVSGDARIGVTLEVLTGPALKVYYVLRFTTTQIIVYDMLSGPPAVVATFTPTNWNPADWNEYFLVAKENEMYLYRSPSGIYREIVPHELVGSVTTFHEEVAGGVDDSQYEWGIGIIGGALPVQPASSVRFRSVAHYANRADGLNWDFDDDIKGNNAHKNPLGMLQGMSIKWNGQSIVKGDNWELDTGAVYEPENIFVASPTRRWREPEQTAGVDSPERIIEWRRPQDSDSEDMNFVFDGFALFGRNFMRFKIEGMDYDGSNPSTLFDSNAGWPNPTQEDFLVGWIVLDVWENVISITAQFAPASFAPMIPDQFKSDGLRNWYIRVRTGVANGNTYRVVGNTADKLILESNAEDDGVAISDTFFLFSSSYFFQFSAEQKYQRIKMTIAAQSRTTSELSLQLGTIVLGRVYDLPTDEWGYNIGYAAKNAIVEARSGYREIRQTAPLRRIINLGYSGLQDVGMAVTSPGELFRSLGGGLYPCVWLDDDSSMVNNANTGHHNPVLARPFGPVQHTHRAYHYFDDTQVDGFGLGFIKRGVHDISGFRLEEVL